MNDLVILANQTPGIVTFDNYEEVKASLEIYINETFAETDYEKKVLKLHRQIMKSLRRCEMSLQKNRKNLRRHIQHLMLLLNQC